jgi:hypothetical protein
MPVQLLYPNASHLTNPCPIQKVNNESLNRYLLIFANRAVADEWWRTVSNSTLSPALSSTIRRIDPQFFTYDPNKYDFSLFWQDPRLKTFLNAFRGQMMAEPQCGGNPKGINIIPSQVITDHISGKW